MFHRYTETDNFPPNNNNDGGCPEGLDKLFRFFFQQQRKVGELQSWKHLVVVVVVSHIQRIGCQPEKTTLHGGQSRSWSAEQGKKEKEKVWQRTRPPPQKKKKKGPPRAARSEKK